MTLDWRDVSLLGIDVGYSPARATTGIAIYRFGHPLELRCVRFDAEERRAALGQGRVFDAVAIDGPLLPDSNFQGLRTCERTLSRGAFGKRCKAGYSHFGEGLKLRNAAMTIAEDIRHMLAPRAPLVEAFPNAFLGVLLDDAAYAAMPPTIPRGQKSDLFYEAALRHGCFERLFAHLGWQDDALKATVRAWATPASRVAHENRAAIVCMLTAGCALAGQSHHIGDAAGGTISLPPRALWARWAQDALEALA